MHDPELGHVGDGEREVREENQVQQPGGPKAQREQITKLVGFYWEGQPSLWAGEFRGCASRRAL